MQKLKFFIDIIVMMFFAIGFSSCEKEYEISKQDEFNNLTSIDDTKALNTVTYYSSPEIGESTYSSSSIVIGGQCGIHNGGVIKATLLSQNGNQFVVRIEKQTGGQFSVGGTAYIKAGSLCGGIAGQTSYSAGVDHVDVIFYATFSRGIVNFYPMTIDGVYGYRYYADPILVWTNPMYNSNWTYGATLGTVDGVNVYCNGTTNSSLSGDYQCIEFVKRYYQQVYQKDLGSFNGRARNLYGLAPSKNLNRFANGNTTTPPRPGDILCYDYGVQDENGDYYGHVAIIIQVESNYIKVAHQNSGKGSSTSPQWYPIGGKLARSGNSITAPNGYLIQGWVRMPVY